MKQKPKKIAFGPGVVLYLRNRRFVNKKKEFKKYFCRKSKNNIKEIIN